MPGLREFCDYYFKNHANKISKLGGQKKAANNIKNQRRPSSRLATVMFLRALCVKYVFADKKLKKK